MNNWKKVTVVK